MATATMNAAQITAELQRKKNAGLQPTDPKNKKQYDTLTVQNPVITQPSKSSLEQTTGTNGVKSQVTPTGTPQNFGTTTSLSSTGGTSQPVMGDYAAQYQALTTQLEKLQNQQFTYDYRADPSFLAAQQAAKDGAKTATKNTMETMNDRGLLKSSVTNSQLGQIQQEAERAPLDLIPGLEANAYNRYQQNFNNQASIIGTLLGQVNNQQKFEADQQWKEADYSGSLETPEMKTLLNSLIQAKTGWANATTTEERNQYAEAGKAARTAMTKAGMQNVEQLFGGNVGIDAALANFTKSGIETVQAQQYREGKEYQTSKDKTEQERWDKTYKLDLDTLAFNKTKAASSGSSGGMTYSQKLQTNTNRMLSTMMGAGVNNYADAQAWVTKNLGEIMAGGIDPTDLLKPFDGGSSGKSGSGTAQGDLYAQAVEMAQKDNGFQTLVEPQEKFDYIWQYYLRLKGMNTPKLTSEQMELNHKVKNLSKYTS